MRTTLAWAFVVKCSHQLLLVPGLLLFAGCVTARVPTGPDVYALKTYPDKPKIGVAQCQDWRTSEKAGSIGLASISVKKQDLEGVLTAYILDCVNRQLDVNVQRMNVENPAVVKVAADSVDVKGFLTTRITRLSIYSADAMMDPAKVELEGEAFLHNAQGAQIFHTIVTGKHSEWIGGRLVDKAAGRLVDAAAREFSHQLGSVMHEEGLLKTLN